MDSATVNWIIGSLALSLILIEITRGCYSRESMPLNDKLINFFSLAQDTLLIRPVLAYACAWLFSVLLPAYGGSLSEVPFWPAFLLVLFGQDFIHYWVHRWAHHHPTLWQVHRTHHSAPAMSVLVTSRLNMLWQVILPANYISGLVIYLGMADVFWAWFGLRAVLNFLTHTNLRWDLPLYRIKILKPFIWVFERIFTTPDAHHAHHGFGENGAPMGNFAPVIILWDFVFGTAHLPHQRQHNIGISEEPILPWYRQLWWPLVSTSVDSGENSRWNSQGRQRE
jgi:sterol desaturase/sphingolipid hydroxylase (fatty acid hydroxylase superfamily)